MKQKLARSIQLFISIFLFAASIASAQVNTGTGSSTSGSKQPPQGPPPGNERVSSNFADPITLFKSGNNTQAATAATKFNYTAYPGDPTNTRVYKLKNGLTVYLSQNKTEPRIQTYIAVRAGSKNDPRETTGLAHYLEHMMFKGTNKIGTTNWSREKMALDQISALYEKQRRETDPEKKKAIYAEIDLVSQEAAKFAVPNEYDKMITTLGAKGTNAYTSKEQTVYVNDIPSNELEKWLVIESERFRECVLRLFQTELEAVYEEYNMGQDRDGTKMSEVYYKALFPTHPYGTQTTIGEGEHLKNPSMVNILQYFNAFYVPNNMAICLSGDLDYEKTIALIDKYFSGYVMRPVPEQKFPVQAPITEIQKREVWGQESETMILGYRLPASGSKDMLIAELVAGILYNGQAGLIDIDLNQKQKVLAAGAYVNDMKEYGVFTLAADPRDDQTLEECETLLINEMNKLKSGAFDEWLMKAVVTDYRLQRTKSFETNQGRANAFVNSFIKNVDWKYYVDEYDNMDKITKEEVVAFANKYFGDTNYVVVYKRKGEDKNVKKVDKPAITPVEANRDAQSDFVKQFMELPSARVAPEFVNFSEKIKTGSVGNGIELSYIKNEEDNIFELYYIFDMGSYNDRMLPIAINYLPYLGTDKYSAAQLQEEFFKYGLSFNVFNSGDRTYVQLSGLEANLEKGLELFEHILSHVQVDVKAYKEYVDGILKERDDNKTSKSYIMNVAMTSYARYGADNPLTDIVAAGELKNMNPQILVDKIKSLGNFKHRMFYYGQRPIDQVAHVISTYHKVPEQLQDYPAAKKYNEQDTKTNQVIFINYDMVQAQILFMSKGQSFSPTVLADARVFNEYFGSGLSSIVFQEIRETKALAYSAYVSYGTPQNKDEAHYVRAFVGTQADKMKDAIEAMKTVMNDMPHAEQQFNASVESVEKQIESERIIRSNIFWNYENIKRKGMNHDYRRDIYNNVKSLTMDDLQKFFDANIAGRNYTIIVMGDKTKLDMDYLKSLGTFKELTLEQAFGY